MPDVLIERGVIHQLGGLLHPVLNWCNASDISIQSGACVDCSLNISALPCPEEFSPFVPARVQHLHCSYEAETGELVPGCNQICGHVPTVRLAQFGSITV
ncbi:hypothetical protein ElyMa_003954900 [Elysia marginata]|uniref:Uncharacterized protein n=1 Tax=Elysia marginata TaxID=1093978 RepID=A0AAV4FTU2_9GAST|nr:hypothetical protein ElyMa_003954900 [Elysia marginata]